jgi:feruloyl esterase
MKIAGTAVLFALGAVLVLASRGQSAQTPTADSADCARLPASLNLPNTEVTRAVTVAAAAGRPDFCEVHAVIRPVAGSEIGVVYRLPGNWNGKLLAYGGGGWMGNVTLQTASEGLARGYATLQTDAGHTTGSGFDAGRGGRVSGTV